MGTDNLCTAGGGAGRTGGGEEPSVPPCSDEDGDDDVHDDRQRDAEPHRGGRLGLLLVGDVGQHGRCDANRKSTRLNSSHVAISYAVFCLKKKKNKKNNR